MLPIWIKRQPLFAAWDGQQGTFAWREGEGGEETADLPFGRCICRMRQEENDVARVDVVVTLDRLVRLHQLEIGYQPAFGRPKTTWAPYLRHKPDYVIADQVFRSPALMMAKSEQAVALVPDLSLWPDAIKTYLDMQREKPAMIHGVGHWRTTGHVFFKKMKAKQVLPAGDEIRFAHFLLKLSELPEDRLDYLASFIWRRFARRNDTKQQMLPFAQAGQHACERIMAPDLYREFQIDERPVAGMITQTVTARKKPKVMDEKGVRNYLQQQDRLIKALGLIQKTLFTNRFGYWLLSEFLHTGWMSILPMTSFQCWFNQVRTALGVALQAKRSDHEQRFAQARRIIDLALSAPTGDGMPASVCLFPEGRVFWKNGTRAFAMTDDHHLPDAAVTGFHLLEWHERIETDKRILPRCRALAKFLQQRQDDDGSVPAWVRREGDSWQVEPHLAKSASTAAPAMFWARLHRIAPDPTCLDAVKKALRFIAREVVPEHKWFDYELELSCAGRPTSTNGPDPYTGCLPENTLSMYWAARACLDVYLADGDEEFLSLGRQVLSHLSMYQQVLDHPRVSIDTFGGFAVMNADAEFNDARQGLFVPLYFDWYRATGRAEYAERAIAALRASFTTMLVEENRPVAPGNLVRFRDTDHGAILENYGHTGRDEPSGGYLSPDWGCGTALYASGLAFQDCGQVLVDVQRKTAFGIDGCMAEFVSNTKKKIEISLEMMRKQPIEIVVVNAKKGDQIFVNGNKAEQVTGSDSRFLHKPK